LGLTSAAGLSLFVFGPSSLYGAGYFSDRMSVVFVLCCLAALAPLTLSRPLRQAAVVTVACLLPLMTLIRDRETAAIVKALAPIYDAKPVQRGGWGAIVAGTEAVDGFNFNPYYWAGAHFARTSKAVLLNAPWIYGRLHVFTPRSTHPWDGAPPENMGRILREIDPAAASQVGFICGGKWESSRRPIASPDSLGRTLGLVRVFESDLYYCDGKPGAALTASLAPDTTHGQ
jgi:hypothetical protein